MIVLSFVFYMPKDFESQSLVNTIIDKKPTWPTRMPTLDDRRLTLEATKDANEPVRRKHLLTSSRMLPVMVSQLPL